MAYVETANYQSTAAMRAGYAEARRRLFRAVGIDDPARDTAKQRREREARRDREMMEAQIAQRNAAAEARRQARISAFRAAEIAHPIIVRDPKAFALTAKSRLIELCKERGVEFLDIVGRSRTRDIVAVRQEFVGVIYREFNSDGKLFTLAQMGKLFDRDHTTILHFMRKCGILSKVTGRSKFSPKSGHAGVFETSEKHWRSRVIYRRAVYPAGTYSTIENAIKARDLLRSCLREGQRPTPVQIRSRVMGELAA